MLELHAPLHVLCSYTKIIIIIMAADQQNDFIIVASIKYKLHARKKRKKKTPMRGIEPRPRR